MSADKKSNKQLKEIEKDPELLAKQKRKEQKIAFKERRKALTPEELKEVEENLERKRKEKQKRIIIKGAKNNKKNEDFIIETNTSTTIRSKNNKKKFSDFELELITYVKQLVTKYKDNEFTKVTFRIKDFLDTIGTINNYKHVREAALKIQNTQIIMKDSNKKGWTVYTSYFSSVITDDNPSEITITIDPEVLNHLGKQHKLFVTYRANIIYKLKGSYPKIMYPYLKSILGKSQRNNTTTRITIEELKELLTIPDDKYPKYTNLNQRVLKSFVEEINKKTDIFIAYTPEKKGRATHKLFFEIRRQKQKIEKINEAMNNPATEQLKKQGFNDDQVSKMLDVKQDFIPDDEYMAILSNYPYIDEEDMLLIDQKLERNKISPEVFKEVCLLANKYYKYKHQRQETNKFSAVNIFNKAIKERWDKSNPTDKEVNPQSILELTTEQKVKEIANSEKLHDDFTDFLFDIGTPKAKDLIKSISKIGIIKTYNLKPHWFNLADKFWTVKG